MPHVRRFLVVLVAASLLAGSTAHAAEQDPRRRREEVQRRRAQAASKVDVLRASERQLEEALDDLDGNVAGEEARLASARQAVDAATRAVHEYQARAEATAAELAALRAEMRSIAVRAYIKGPGYGPLAALDAPSAAAAATRQHLVDAAVGRATDVADALRAAREDHEAEQAAAEEARRGAEERRRAVEGRLDSVERARGLKQQVAESVEERLERALAEAASLEALDRQLAREIAARQAALARRVTTARPRTGRASVPAGRVDLTSVRGIVVATRIAGRLEALLAAAEADGFVLSGGGYRSSEGQVAARRAHCGPTDDDVYRKPASQCRPPTARPGHSMHEQGLAVDFTYQGRVISGRGNPAFGWLGRNAARFGFYNLPREPWHWSTNGN